MQAGTAVFPAAVWLLLALLASGNAGAQSLVVRFLAVGYGDAIVIQAPEGQVVLVDGGYDERGPQLVRNLQALGIGHLEYLVVTHFHPDHAGGLAAVLEAIPVENPVLVAYFPDEVEPGARRILERLRQMPRRQLKRGDQVSLSASVHLEVLHPETLSGDPNGDSLVLMLRYRKTRLLLGGDVGADAQRAIVDRYGPALRADLIKIPHHGLGGIPEFIEQVRPRFAVLTVGPNPYGAPDERLLEQYRRAGARIYRTDRRGEVRAVSDGHAWAIETERVR